MPIGSSEEKGDRPLYALSISRRCGLDRPAIRSAEWLGRGMRDASLGVAAAAIRRRAEERQKAEDSSCWGANLAAQHGAGMARDQGLLV